MKRLRGWVGEWVEGGTNYSLGGGGGGGGDQLLPPTYQSYQHRQTEPIHMVVGEEVLPI